MFVVLNARLCLLVERAFNCFCGARIDFVFERAFTFLLLNARFVLNARLFVVERAFICVC